METRTISLEVLLKEGLFDVPSYQRSYSWEKPQLQDLFDDLVYLPESSMHFFGNLILDKRTAAFQAGETTFDIFDVVDGQQRLISTLLFFTRSGQPRKDRYRR
jgi:uncharacterized protein with ParB-like and HNH nuclease domain